MYGLVIALTLSFVYGDSSASLVVQAKADDDKREYVGDCFLAHGRLRETNGIAYRIWWIGKDRMLGADDGDIPEKLASLLDDGVDAFGDFKVCPFTKRVEGEMQMVRVESVSNVVLVDHRPEDKGGKTVVRKLSGRTYHN